MGEGTGNPVGDGLEPHSREESLHPAETSQKFQTTNFTLISTHDIIIIIIITTIIIIIIIIIII